uniref:Uncharacterized protein n=1 Tax=Periophthalmus magnuspinnatus TaxID=409849 RepID=A0A3B3ZEK8_9GOBI
MSPTSAMCTPTGHSSCTPSPPPRTTATSTTTTTSAPRRTRRARSAAPTSASKLFSGSPTLSVWQTNARCGETSTSAWCPGRETPCPSSQVGILFSLYYTKPCQFNNIIL